MDFPRICNYLRGVPQVVFTKNLQRHVSCPVATVPGATVREALDAVFADNARLRAYVLDEQGALRKHMVVFVDGRQIQDRVGLSDPVTDNGEIYVMQALSGGA
jgi:sulfur-carrier protein